MAGLHSRSRPQILTIAIALSLIIVALAIGYYLVIFLPSKFEAEQDANFYQQTSKELTESATSIALKDCNKQFFNKLRNDEFDSALKGMRGTIEEAQKIIDLWVKNCMAQKGYSDY